MKGQLSKVSHKEVVASDAFSDKLPNTLFHGTAPSAQYLNTLTPTCILYSSANENLSPALDFTITLVTLLFPCRPF